MLCIQHRRPCTRPPGSPLSDTYRWVCTACSDHLDRICVACNRISCRTCREAGQCCYCEDAGRHRPRRLCLPDCTERDAQSHCTRCDRPPEPSCADRSVPHFLQDQYSGKYLYLHPLYDVDMSEQIRVLVREVFPDLVAFLLMQYILTDIQKGGCYSCGSFVHIYSRCWCGQELHKLTCCRCIELPINQCHQCYDCSQFPPVTRSAISPRIWARIRAYLQ
jgi:hypothetical protein